MALQHLFVDGLLMSSMDHTIAQTVSKYCHSLGNARVSGLLYEIGGYSGLILKPDKWVFGELLKVQEGSSELFLILDDFEGVSGKDDDEYVRTLTNVLFESNVVQTWVYIYSRPVQNFPIIRSGFYRKP